MLVGLGAGGGTAQAETAVKTLVFDAEAVDLAVNLATNKIYAALANGNVGILDGATLTTTTVAVGIGPVALAVNQSTDRIYVANRDSHDVSVIDGATGTVVDTVAAGTSPVAIAVNALTNRVYVANEGGDAVTVIDGADQTVLTTVTVGAGPVAVAVHPVTNRIYVANRDSDDVTVIDGATNTTSTVEDDEADGPVALAVNPVTDSIYVVNQLSDNVTLIDGATNGTTTITDAGADGPVAVAVNPVTNAIYVANAGSDTVTVIDGATNATAAVTISSIGANITIAVNPLTDTYYVGGQVFDGATDTSRLGFVLGFPDVVAVNPVTDRIYIAHAPNAVTVLNGIAGYGGVADVMDDIPAEVSGVEFGARTDSQAFNPMTGRLYATDLAQSGVSVIDPATGTVLDVLEPAGGTQSVAVDPVTNRVYVASGEAWLTVIDGVSHEMSSIPLPAGTRSRHAEVNPLTSKIYVLLNDDIAPVVPGIGVAVVDGVSGSFVTTFPLASTFDIDVNPVTNKIYVSGGNSGVLVIDGATDTVLETIDFAAVGPARALVVNPRTNKIYVGVPGLDDEFVVVIDGATDTILEPPIDLPGTGNSALENSEIDVTSNKVYLSWLLTDSGVGSIAVVDGATDTFLTTIDPPSLGAAPKVYDLAVNPASGTVYGVVVLQGTLTHYLLIGDGVSDATLNLGVSAPAQAFLLPEEPFDVVANPSRGEAYVASAKIGSGYVTVLSEQPVQEVPLMAGIVPLPGDVTHGPSPAFEFAAASTFSPVAPPPDGVWFQVDTWQGSWTPATSEGGGVFSGQLPEPLVVPGVHILYAYATDGQNATSTLTGAAEAGGSGPLISNIAAYPFLFLPTVCGEANDLELTSGTVTTAEERIACFTITAGSSFAVGASGDLTLRAGESVILEDGFSVEEGGQLTVVVDPGLTEP